MKKLVTFICLLTAFSAWAQEAVLVHYPAINHDGTEIAFGYQGDIWTMPISGGKARRLTIHESYESKPRWNKDGSKILFQSNRYGNNDLFILNTDDGTPTRLTYHSASDYDAQWGANDNIIFNTRRVYQQVEREGEIYSISTKGGTPYRYMNALGLMPAPSPDGKYIVYIKGSCKPEREAYTGPANRNLFLHNIKKNTHTQLSSFEGQEIYPRWAKGFIYYLKAQGGKYNIYKMNPKSPTKEVALTSFSDEGIRYFDISRDGKTIVFDRGEHIYTMDVATKKVSSPLNIEVTKDFRFDPIEEKTFTNRISNYAISPNEKQVALEVHGEIFIKRNNKKKPRTVRVTNHPYRDKEPLWLNDSTLLFVSDRNGTHDIYMVQSTDAEESDLFMSFKRKITQLTNDKMEVENISLSPDGKKLQYTKGRGMLLVSDISPEGNLTNTKTLADGWSSPSGIAWSPDSRWLAYSASDLNFNSEIYIQSVDGGKPVNVSLHPRGDNSPVWSRDGSKLGFLSIRNNGDADVWFVWLQKEDWEKTRQDWDDDDDTSDEKEIKKDSLVHIDFNNIHERIQQITSLPSNEGNLIISPDGETFMFSTNGGGRMTSSGTPDYKSIKWNGEDMKTLIKGKRVSNIQLDKKGDSFYCIIKGSLTKVIAKSGKQEMFPFKAKMMIDHKAERAQVFEEGWRRLRDGFYDPNFHGRDWEALRNKYRGRCLNASTKQDYARYYNEMLGQLDASHMGYRTGTPEDVNRESTGILGIEVTPQPSGVKVTHVVANTPADKSDSKLNIGDIILSVNGQAISEHTNFHHLLLSTANEKILLTVRDSNNQERDVVIRPTSSIRGQLYKSWVNEQKRLTDKYSNGRLGYIHIQGMNWTSFERFERELMASGLGKEGIVIDVRYNGGGWTTDMLMAVLNVKQHAYTVPRGAAKDLAKENHKFKETYPYGERLPLSSWTKPSIALCNQNSYSNAEIFSHAFKHLGIGTLVGMPTFGAVISTGGSGLMDGSFVRMPFRAWYVKATGENMEWGPAVPDIIVENTPDARAKGEDLQLKKAVAQLLSEIK